MSRICRSPSACWRCCGCSKAARRMSDSRIELTVSEEDAGERLDRFLAAPLGSRARAQSLIDADRVLVDGERRPKRHVVRTGELVEIRLPRPTGVGAVVESVDFRVAYEDVWLLIVDKPAGVVVHPA